MRITTSTPLLPAVQRGKAIQITVDGQPVQAYEGETIAAALLAAGISTFGWSRQQHRPRGLFCGMGVCFECLVTVDGLHAVRACITPVTGGMKVETRRELTL